MDRPASRAPQLTIPFNNIDAQPRGTTAAIPPPILVRIFCHPYSHDLSQHRITHSVA